MGLIVKCTEPFQRSGRYLVFLRNVFNAVLHKGAPSLCVIVTEAFCIVALERNDHGEHVTFMLSYLFRFFIKIDCNTVA